MAGFSRSWRRSLAALPWLFIAGSVGANGVAVPMDVDVDGDVDGVDFAVFAACFNKTGNPPRTLGCPPENALAFDDDNDGDVDGVDFAVFAACFNKAGRPPRCDNPPPSPLTLESIIHAADRSAGGYEIILTCSGALSEASAENVNHYRVTSSAENPIAATLSPDGLSVSLIFETPIAITDTIDFSIGDGVKDAVGQPLAEQLAQPVADNPADVTSPTATVQLSGPHQAAVVFSEAMDESSAEVIAHYFNMDAMIGPTTVALLDDGKSVELTFAVDPQWDDIRVSTVNSILDINGNSMVQEIVPAKALEVAAIVKLITPVTPNGTPLANPSRAVNHSHPVYLAGFGDNRPAFGVHDELWARCLVLRFAETTLAIVSVDLVGYANNEVQEIRALLTPGTADYLVVASTHNHEGPDTIGIWGPDPLTSGVDPNYIDFVNGAIVEGVEEGVAALTPAKLKMTTVNSAGLSLGTDPEDDGFGVADTKVLLDDNLVPGNIAGRIIDPNISVMQFVDPDSLAPLVTFMDFGSHPESLGVQDQLTSDFPHYVREQLETVLGGTAVYASGAVGVLQGPLRLDVLDTNTGQAAPRRTFHWTEIHGRTLADRAIDAITAVTEFSLFPKLDYRTSAPVDIRLDNPFFRFFFGTGTLLPDRGLFTAGFLDSSTGVDPVFNQIPIPLGQDLRSEVAALRIGEAGVAVLPSELDPQIGFGYRQRLNKADQTLIIGLGNDELGYQLPVEKWDNSCHACGYYVIAGQPCPVSPVDCNTVFENNVGSQMDPVLSGAINPILDDLNAANWNE